MSQKTRQQAGLRRVSKVVVGYEHSEDTADRLALQTHFIKSRFRVSTAVGATIASLAFGQEAR